MYPRQHQLKQVMCSVDLIQQRHCFAFLSGLVYYLLALGSEDVRLNCGSLELDSGDERLTFSLQTVEKIAQ